jgi:Protein of unknown function (DUF2934)
MAHRTSSPHSATSDPESPVLTEELVRQRAYQLYEERGREDGHDMDDWLRAEAEMLGKRPSGSVTDHEAAAISAVAG